MFQDLQQMLFCKTKKSFFGNKPNVFLSAQNIFKNNAQNVSSITKIFSPKQYIKIFLKYKKYFLKYINCFVIYTKSFPKNAQNVFYKTKTSSQYIGYMLCEMRKILPQIMV